MNHSHYTSVGQHHISRFFLRIRTNKQGKRPTDIGFSSLKSLADIWENNQHDL